MDELSQLHVCCPLQEIVFLLFDATEFQALRNKLFSCTAAVLLLLAY